jgi:cysteinyl-tRNA synthetase
MDDDLHTPEAIAVLFDVAREANRALEQANLGVVAAAVVCGAVAGCGGAACA